MEYTFGLLLWIIILTFMIVILWAKTEKVKHILYGQFQLQKAINGSHSVGLKQMIDEIKELQKQIVKLNLEVGLLQNKVPSYHSLDPIYLDNLAEGIINTAEEDNWEDDPDTSEEEFLEAQIDEVEELQELSQQRIKL